MRWIRLGALVGLAPCVLWAQPAPSTQAPAWMAGCWRAVTGVRMVEEWWMPPVGDVMPGMGRTTGEARTMETEQLRIARVGDRLVYIAHPSGQRETEFTATTVSPSEAVFENAQHDFPRRIAYARAGADSLTATVGNPGGRTFTLRFARVRCDHA
ncbi:MAG: DUF6265 family protein [Gemmatimonadaceae bacterium]|nr:DUF6265 family protein [Gemmatimonadaceae bacterium]